MHDAESLSLQTLYTEHHGWLVQWLRRRLGNKDSAMDLAQDTFVRVMTKSDIPALKEPRVYLSVIAKHLLADHYRHNSLEQAYLDGLAALPEPQHPSPEARAIMLETLSAIDRMLDSLPEKVRCALLLSQLEGMRYEAIAVQLGVSLRTVKRYMEQGFEACLLAIHEQQ